MNRKHHLIKRRLGLLASKAEHKFLGIAIPTSQMRNAAFGIRQPQSRSSQVDFFPVPTALNQVKANLCTRRKCAQADGTSCLKAATGAVERRVGKRDFPGGGCGLGVLGAVPIRDTVVCEGASVQEGNLHFAFLAKRDRSNPLMRGRRNLLFGVREGLVHTSEKPRGKSEARDRVGRNSQRFFRRQCKQR